MNADYETAAWSHHHDSFTRWINKVMATIDTSLAALNRYEFDAPWRGRAGPRPRRN